MPQWLSILFTCIIGYMLGSLSGGIITSRLANGPDLYTVGSKSTGASNVQRTMGWKYGIITFLFDAVKGLLTCLIAWLITGSHMVSLLAGLCCVIGHNWPVFFRFPRRKRSCHYRSGYAVLFSVACADLYCDHNCGHCTVQIHFCRKYASGDCIFYYVLFLQRRKYVHYHLGCSFDGDVYFQAPCQHWQTHPRNRKQAWKQGQINGGYHEQ